MVVVVVMGETERLKAEVRRRRRRPRVMRGMHDPQASVFRWKTCPTQLVQCMNETWPWSTW